MNRPALDQISPQGAISCPTKARVWLYLQINLALNMLFVVVYGGANLLASMRSDQYHFYAEWERNIPLVPIMIYVYFSISLLFLVPLYVLDSMCLKRLGVAASLCIAIAGLFFVLLPGTIGFAPASIIQSTDSIEAWLFRVLHHMDKPYNTAPSLHIGLSTLIVLATIQSSTSRCLTASLLLWLFMLMISVVLVHQHHLVDVATGWILGYGCYLYYCRQVRIIR